jgi:hypothetical protein
VDELGDTAERILQFIEQNPGCRDIAMNRQWQYLFLPLMSIWLNNIGIRILD